MSIRLLPRIIGYVAFALALFGCTSKYQPEQELSSYVNDLARSKYISIHVPDFHSPALYPRLEARQRALTKFDISILDFLSLQQCDVGYLAGEKNSVLGRVMLNSQRFLYEINIIRAIETCPVENEALAEKLHEVSITKRKELPIAFINAVFNGEEAAEFFSLSNGFIPQSNSMENYQALFVALQNLLSIGQNLRRLPNIQSKHFEEGLKTIADSEYAGQLLYSLAQLTRYLNAVSLSVESLSNSVCGAPLVFLKEQFTQHYIKRIQPYMARLNSTAYKILPILSQLKDIGQPLPMSLNRYLTLFSLESKTGMWQQYQRASQRHASAWSQLFTRCSVSIGS